MGREGQMPDADDFDVENFRDLMKGNSPKEKHAVPVEPSPPVVKKTAGRTSKPTTATGRSMTTAGRKKSKNQGRD